MIEVIQLRATLATVYPEQTLHSVREIMLYLISEGKKVAETSESLAALVSGVTSMVRKRSFQVYMDCGGRIVGYCMWESIAPTQANGSMARIVHFFSAKQALRLIIAQLSNTDLRDCDSVIYTRRIRSRSVTKMVSRLDYCHLFRNVNPYISPQFEDAFARVTPGAATAAVEFLNYAQSMGKALVGLSLDKRYNDVPIAVLLHRLDHLIAMRQIKIYTDRSGDVIGIMTWTRLSKYTFSQLSCRPLANAHPSEWNEGVILCLWDSVFHPDIFTEVTRDLKEMSMTEVCENGHIYIALDISATTIIKLRLTQIAEDLRDLLPRRSDDSGIRVQGP